MSSRFVKIYQGHATEVQREIQLDADRATVVSTSVAIDPNPGFRGELTVSVVFEK